ncbi:AAA family ATPase [Pseudomonas oryzihabitans]
MLVLVGNTKGGVGKSVETIQIAAARALQDRNVLIVDGDR